MSRTTLFLLLLCGVAVAAFLWYSGQEESTDKGKERRANAKFFALEAPEIAGLEDIQREFDRIVLESTDSRVLPEGAGDYLLQLVERARGFDSDPEYRDTLIANILRVVESHNILGPAERDGDGNPLPPTAENIRKYGWLHSPRAVKDIPPVKAFELRGCS